MKNQKIYEIYDYYESQLEDDNDQSNLTFFQKIKLFFSYIFKNTPNFTNR